MLTYLLVSIPFLLAGAVITIMMGVSSWSRKGRERPFLSEDSLTYWIKRDQSERVFKGMVL